MTMSFSQYIALREGANENPNLEQVLENFTRRVYELRRHLHEQTLVPNEKLELLIEDMQLLNEFNFSGLGGGIGRAFKDTVGGIANIPNRLKQGWDASKQAAKQAVKQAGKYAMNQAGNAYNTYYLEPQKISANIAQLQSLKKQLGLFQSQLQAAAGKQAITVGEDKLRELNDISQMLDLGIENLNKQMVDRKQVAQPQHIK